MKGKNAGWLRIDGIQHHTKGTRIITNIPYTAAQAHSRQCEDIMEIFTLEISLPYDTEDEPWIRVIEVKEDCTLWQLHDYIQEIVGFDNDHLYEFYMGKHPRNRTGAIADNSTLNEIYPMTGFKLYYLFDFGDCWLFQIKKSRKRVLADSKVKYPRVVKSTGENPEQYPEYEE